MNILVTGGAGYIGSHAVRELVKEGHQVWVLDNLANGHIEAVDPKAKFVHGATSNLVLIRKILVEQDIEAVMHFAADIEVGESVIDPLKYYRNNFTNSLMLLQAMIECDVKKIVFSSTAAVYGNPVKVPIEENQDRSPINPYGRSKMMVEMALEDLSHSHGLGFTILRYFNVAGASEDASIGEDHQPETHLIPRILQAAQNHTAVKIFGTDYPTHDGTCIRDYVHVVDLARAHVLAIQNLKEGEKNIFNLGSESGFSVREVLNACQRATGLTLQFVEEARRPGDPAVLVANSQKIRNELKWEPLYPDMESIVSHAWQWHEAHPKGFEKSNIIPFMMGHEMNSELTH